MFSTASSPLSHPLCEPHTCLTPALSDVCVRVCVYPNPPLFEERSRTVSQLNTVQTGCIQTLSFDWLMRWCEDGCQAACVCVCVSGAACEAAGTILGTGSIGSRHKNTHQRWRFPCGAHAKNVKTRDIKMRNALPNGCRTADTPALGVILNHMMLGCRF